jgi:hypothetical protein
VPFEIVLLLLLIAGVALIGVALSGYGSPDRSRQAPPRLPGHDVQEERARREKNQKPDAS